MKKRVTWTKEEWSDWRWHQKYRIRNLEQLEEWIDVTPDEREAFRLTDPVFHMGITPYYASLRCSKILTPNKLTLSILPKNDHNGRLIVQDALCCHVVHSRSHLSYL